MGRRLPRNPRPPCKKKLYVRKRVSKYAKTSPVKQDSSPVKTPVKPAPSPVKKRKLKAHLSQLVFVCPRKSCSASSDTTEVWGDYELGKRQGPGSIRAVPVGNACGRYKKAFTRGHEDADTSFDSCVAECNASVEKDLEFERCARVCDGIEDPPFFRSSVGKHLKSGHRSLLRWTAVSCEGWKSRFPDNEPKDLGFKSRRLLHPHWGRFVAIPVEDDGKWLVESITSYESWAEVFEEKCEYLTEIGDDVRDGHAEQVWKAVAHKHEDEEVHARDMRLAGLEVLTIDTIEKRIEERRLARQNALDDQEFSNHYVVAEEVIKMAPCTLR